MILIFVCFYQVSNVSGQVLKVNIKVNSTVGMQQLMPYEVLSENQMQASVKGELSQRRSINAMGAFTITGKENMNLLIRLDAPEVLVNKENQTIPYQMKVAWLNNASTDVNTLNWSNSKDNTFKLTRSLNVVETKKMQDDDTQASLYLKGTTEVRANSSSPFEGNVKLTIEY